MSGKGGFGHFSSSTRYGNRENTPEEFKKRQRKKAARINVFVFDNGKESKTFNLDTGEAVRPFGANVLYLDPPYPQKFRRLLWGRLTIPPHLGTGT